MESQITHTYLTFNILNFDGKSNNYQLAILDKRDFFRIRVRERALLRTHVDVRQADEHNNTDGCKKTGMEKQVFISGVTV